MILQTFQIWMEQIGFGPLAITGILFSIKVACILLLSVIADVVAKRFIVVGVRTVIQKTENTWDDILVEKNVFESLSHIAPAWVIYASCLFAFPQNDVFVNWIQRLALVYMLVVGFAVVNSVLNVLLEVYARFEVSKRRPIKGYVQIAKIGLHFLCGIFILSILLNKSPWGLLSVMGGLTAVVMLVFKDTILGFVASIQLISNNMVVKGDWIEMPKYGADGDVIDISINTIKIQNWDKTITTIPTYALIADSFKNWRGMSESGGRRIKRAINIDMGSIRFCDDAMLEKFARFEYLKDYLKDKRSELSKANHGYDMANTDLVNGRRLTNIGTFRAYIVAYLKQHPKIQEKMTFLVRHLSPTAYGIPIEIYVFSNDQVWANYEAIQADIFDHILAIVLEFELRVFQYPSGSDLADFSRRSV